MIPALIMRFASFEVIPAMVSLILVPSLLLFDNLVIQTDIIGPELLLPFLNQGWVFLLFGYVPGG